MSLPDGPQAAIDGLIAHADRVVASALSMLRHFDTRVSVRPVTVVPVCVLARHDDRSRRGSSGVEAGALCVHVELSQGGLMGGVSGGGAGADRGTREEQGEHVGIVA